MGYVHYYLSTAYQLLCSAMKGDPAGILPAVESDIQQSQVRIAVMWLVVVGESGLLFRQSELKSSSESSEWCWSVDGVFSLVSLAVMVSIS